MKGMLLNGNKHSQIIKHTKIKDSRVNNIFVNCCILMARVIWPCIHPVHDAKYECPVMLKEMVFVASNKKLTLPDLIQGISWFDTLKVLTM